jgi:hypothetical protein
MSIFSAPPTTTKYGFKRGDHHIGVWALQSFLNSYDGKFSDWPLTEDGIFGAGTERAVRWYQGATDASVDGIVGPQTQQRIVRSCIIRTLNGQRLPKGLLEGQIDAESGRLIAAVNASVPGGVDCGLTQMRVYYPYSETAVKAAFDPLVNVYKAVNADVPNGFKGLLPNYSTFSARVGPGEYAWRLAALAHNWPSAADTLSKGGTLSTTREATWVPASVRFDDGADVYSWRDWAEFYALGSAKHRHAGLVTKLAFGIPVR